MHSPSAVQPSQEGSPNLPSTKCISRHHKSQITNRYHSHRFTKCTPFATTLILLPLHHLPPLVFNVQETSTHRVQLHRTHRETITPTVADTTATRQTVVKLTPPPPPPPSSSTTAATLSPTIPFPFRALSALPIMCSLLPRRRPMVPSGLFFATVRYASAISLHRVLQS